MSRADPLRIADYLQHILEAIDNIQDYTDGMNLDAFMADHPARPHRGAIRPRSRGGQAGKLGSDSN